MGKRKLKLGPNRGKSKLCEVRTSRIHGSGVFATQFIPESTRIIEYVGERIDKKESEERGWQQMERSRVTGEAGVYIFTLDDKWDIDGDIPQNIARLINHSCSPNCEAYIERKRIWIWSIRDIEPDEEIVFNYGFDLENYKDHPCACGSENCVGYIVGQEYWDKLKKRRKREPATAS